MPRQDEGQLTRIDTPAASSAAVRAKMQAQASFDTRPELALRRALHRLGVRFQLDARLPGLPRRSADIVWRKRKLAVFVDGCFWHGCPSHFVPPKSNADWWAGKIDRNRTRDGATNSQLVAKGWTVVRVWEHTDPVEAAVIIARLLSTRPGGLVALD